MKKESYWNKNFILIFIAGFFSSMVTSSLLATMAVYSMTTYGIGEGLAGFAASIMMVGAILGRMVCGRYMDQIGRRRIALLASFLSLVICSLYFLPTSVVVFLIIRFSHGVMGGSVHNVVATAVLDFIPAARRAEGIAFYTLCFTVAMAIGPSLSLYIISTWSYFVFYTLNLFFALASLAILAAVKFKHVAPPAVQPKQHAGKPKLSDYFDKLALPLSFTAILISICYTGVSAFVENYTALIGVAWIASPFFTIYAVCILAARPIAGRLIDRHGENSLMIPAIIAFAVSLFTLGLSGLLPGAAPFLIILTAVIMAVGFGTVLPMGQAVAIKYAPPERFGRIISTFFIFTDVGFGFGALIWGSVATLTGFSTMYFAETIVVLAGLFVYWQLHGRHHRTVKGVLEE